MTGAATTRNLTVVQLRTVYRDVFSRLGVPADDVEIIAANLLDADLNGTDSHGIARVPTYVDRILTGGIKPVTVITTIDDSGSTLLLDAGAGVGQVAAHRAAEMLIERTAKFGTASVAVRNANHLGALAYYTRMAAEHDQIALLISGVASTLAPWGGSEALLGSNPWSVACPAAEHDMVILDMANGLVTSGEIRHSALTGESLPPGVALSADGEPTTDGSVALRGSIVPIGGHKGYALTFVWEILASVLTGASFSRYITKFEDPSSPKGIGYLFIGLDIARFMEPAAFKTRVDELIDIVTLSRAIGGREIRYPGAHAGRTRRERTERGVPVTDEVIGKVRSACTQVGAQVALSVLAPLTYSAAAGA